ncbi:MAG TPA: sigma-70 family RNA polymerase sigma factor, partial [Candidatus Bathyarchaeia archaeon]|nr:sigma-70 family RNA polymerase sigma factor [Candidatus Bathyarchaeia archaeon]
MLAFVHSDRAVVRRVLGGNSGAFRVLVERYGGVIHGVAFARLQNSADAEDVAQETFTRFYQQLDRMAHHKHIGAWLVHVARNACIDLARKRARETELDDRKLVARATMPNPAREELHRLLWEQLQGLDVESREVLVLHYFMKKRAREIAALLEITPDAAAKRIQRAREELGRRLTDLLGAEIKEVMPDARRTQRITAAVLATPVAWKASAAGASGAATAAGVATGAGAAKMAAVVAIIAVAAILGYLAYDRYAQPYSTQDVTAQSAITVEEATQEEAQAAFTVPPPAPAAPQTAETAAADTAGAAGEPVYPLVYGTIRGMVSMEDGTPAPGAEVWLDNQQEVDQYAYAVKSGYSDEFEPVEPIRLSARSDAAGRFALTGVPLSSIPRGRRSLHARLGDYCADSELITSHIKRELEQDLTLLRAFVLGGIVKGLDGRPVKGAWVQLAEYEGNRTALSANQWQHHGAETGEDGQFLIENLPVEECRLSVGASGYLDYTSPWLEAGSRDNVIELEVGGLVSGRVVDSETGQAVGNVVVRGQGINNNANNYILFQGEADSSGVFEIGACKPGTYRMSVVPKVNGVLPLRLVEPLTVTVGAQPVTGLELRMVRGAVLRGWIIDDETGTAPTVVTAISVRNEASGEGRVGKAKADGSYEVV